MKDPPSSPFDIARRVSRRQVLRAGSLGLLGLSLPELLAGREVAAAETPPEGGTTNKKPKGSFGRAKSCILLFMWGGPAHQDTWDLKPEAPAEFRGEFQPISTKVSGIQISEHFPRLAERTDKLAIVRSMTHNSGDHLTGTHFLLTGLPPPPSKDRQAEWPHMGAVLSRLGRGQGSLPPFISFRPKLENDVPRFVEESQGQFAGWLGPVYDPLSIDQDPSRADYRVAETAPHPELPTDRLNSRRDLLAQLDRGLSGKSPKFEAADVNYRRAFDLLTSATEQRGAFNLADEPVKVRERYGLNPHGQSVLQARRLIERGVPLVTVFWPSDGIKNVSVYWDTHSRNFVDLKERLMPPADVAFSALLDDLSERGLLDETLVIWTGEFGRTPRVGQVSSDAGAGRDGRDHWPGCFSTVLAGGGVRGGIVYGKSDRQAAFPASDPVAPQDLIATAYHLLGVPEGQVLPDLSGRPQFVRPGRAIKELI